MMRNMKGSMPGISALVIVLIIFALFILDKADITEREFEVAITEKSAYSVLHQSEMFKRTIDSGVWFAVQKGIYALGNAGLQWSDTSPSDEELKAVLEEMIRKDVVNINGRKDGNVTIETEVIDFDISQISDDGFVISGQNPFSAEYISENFKARMESSGKFNRTIETKYFKLASLMRESVTCPLTPIEETIDNRYLRKIESAVGTNYTVSVIDTLDSDPFSGGNLEISVGVICP